jgi:hypothetical protein
VTVTRSFVGKTARPVPVADLGGALLFVDAGAGQLLRSVAIPSEPVDVLVLEPRPP